MSPGERTLDRDIERLLAEPCYAHHPLRAGLERLWQQYQFQVERMERIADRSGRQHVLFGRRGLPPSQRFERQLRQMEKLSRVSDRYQAMLHELNDALRQASTHDLLTGLGNRRYMSERLQEEVVRCDRYSARFVVAMLEIDRFRELHGEHGHEFADRLLAAVAEVLMQALRDSDICGRWDVQTFLLLLPHTTLESCAVVVDRVREGIAGLNLRDAGRRLALTINLGLAEHETGEDYAATVRRAEAAMRDAQSARWQVEIG